MGNDKRLQFSTIENLTTFTTHGLISSACVIFKLLCINMNKCDGVPLSLFRWTGTSLLILLFSSSVDSRLTIGGSFWASQSATLLSEAMMAACRVLRSLPPTWGEFLGRGRDTWSLMVTFPGEVLSNSMVNEVLVCAAVLPVAHLAAPTHSVSFVGISWMLFSAICPSLLGISK